MCVCVQQCLLYTGIMKKILTRAWQWWEVVWPTSNTFHVINFACVDFIWEVYWTPSRAHPLPILLLVPHLHLLVRGTGGHPLPVEIVRHIVDQVLVVRIDAFRHVHLSPFSGWEIPCLKPLCSLYICNGLLQVHMIAGCIDQTVRVSWLNCGEVWTGHKNMISPSLL